MSVSQHLVKATRRWPALPNVSNLLCVTYGRQTAAKSDLQTARLSADQLHGSERVSDFAEAEKRQQNALGIDRHFLS
jgi:hypothetical protein